MTRPEAEHLPPSRLLALLHRAEQAAERIVAESLAQIGMTPRQAMVLIAIAERDGASQTVLTVSTGIDRSTMADILKRLQNKGLVTRRRSRSDRREQRVELTVAGHAALGQSRSAMIGLDNRLAGALGESAFSGLVATLEMLSAPSFGQSPPTAKDCALSPVSAAKTGE